MIGYWFKALIQCPMLKNEIYEKDEPILKQLNKIEQNIVYNDHYQQKELNFGSNEKIIEIIFHFNVNDYFHNKTLNKIFILQDDDQPAKTEASHIDWKEGKNVTKKTIKQLQKNKKTGATRTITKEVDDISFFNFFKSFSLEKEGIVDQKSEEQSAKLQELMDIHYDMARSIIDELIPYSLEYYLGVRKMDQTQQQQQIQSLEAEQNLEQEKKKKKKVQVEKEKEDKGERNECK